MYSNYFHNLTASFFEIGAMATPNKSRNPFWVKGFRLVPNGHTLAGFAIGALHLATMAIVQLRALHKTQNMFLYSDFNFLSTLARKDHLLPGFEPALPCVCFANLMTP